MRETQVRVKKVRIKEVTGVYEFRSKIMYMMTLETLIWTIYLSRVS